MWPSFQASFSVCSVRLVGTNGRLSTSLPGFRAATKVV